MESIYVSTGESSLTKMDNLSREIWVNQRKLNSYKLKGGKLGVKIDVEGNEFKVLKGMSSILNNVDWMIIEMNNKFLNLNNTSVDEIVRFLEKFNFNINLKSSIGINKLFEKK